MKRTLKTVSTILFIVGLLILLLMTETYLLIPDGTDIREFFLSIHNYILEYIETFSTISIILISSYFIIPIIIRSFELKEEENDIRRIELNYNEKFKILSNQIINLDDKYDKLKLEIALSENAVDKQIYKSNQKLQQQFHNLDITYHNNLNHYDEANQQLYSILKNTNSQIEQEIITAIEKFENSHNP